MRFLRTNSIPEFKILDNKIPFYLDTYMNISFNLNQRLQLDVVTDDLEIEIKSINRFGIFGSSSPKLVASIVSHDWFHPFDGEVIIYVLMIIALIEISIKYI